MLMTKKILFFVFTCPFLSIHLSLSLLSISFKLPFCCFILLSSFFSLLCLYHGRKWHDLCRSLFWKRSIGLLWCDYENKWCQISSTISLFFSKVVSDLLFFYISNIHRWCILNFQFLLIFPPVLLRHIPYTNYKK